MLAANLINMAAPGAATGEPPAAPIRYRRNLRARRYILKLDATGQASVTIPRGGSQAEAERFVARHAGWLEKRLRKLRETIRTPVDETKVLFRGEMVPLVTLSETLISFAEHTVETPPGSDRRARLKEKLWRLARAELPVRIVELAQLHGLVVKRVSVRDQSSRWGSCSASGRISLNWRLIQVPDWVRDYVIVHELMHLREMNHSARFWKLVNEAFPRTPEARRWLRVNNRVLRNDFP